MFADAGFEQLKQPAGRDSASLFGQQVGGPAGLGTLDVSCIAAC